MHRGGRRVKAVVKKLISDLFSVEMLLYMLFGVGTAAIDIFTAKVLYDTLSRSAFLKPSNNVVIANTASFILSVTFAFFTNKFFVFKSKSQNSRHIRKEAFKFFFARFLTFGLSLFGMVILVDSFTFDHDVAKIIVSIVVIILNYVFSKLIVFKADNNSEITDFDIMDEIID